MKAALTSAYYGLWARLPDPLFDHYHAWRGVYEVAAFVAVGFLMGFLVRGLIG